jgi:hypothetical protein
LLSQGRYPFVRSRPTWVCVDLPPALWDWRVDLVRFVIRHVTADPPAPPTTSPMSRVPRPSKNQSMTVVLLYSLCSRDAS